MYYYYCDSPPFAIASTMSSEFTAVTLVVTLTITFGVTITVTAASLLACLLAWLACLAGLQRSLAQLKNYQSEKSAEQTYTAKELVVPTP